MDKYSILDGISWKNKWYDMYLSILKISESIRKIFPIKILNRRINNLEELLTEMNKDFDFKFDFKFENNYSYNHLMSDEQIEWLCWQKNLFDKGTLTSNRIEKLKLLGLFENNSKFNKDDKYVFDLYFENVEDLNKPSSYLSKDNWQLKVAKYFVLKYYYRKENQSYDIRDYIECIIKSLIEIEKENTEISFNRLEQRILTKIKILNSHKKIDEVSLKNQTYDINRDIDLILLKKYIKDILNEFDESTRRIIKYRYGITDNENDDLREHTLRECADEFNISTERIRQIEKKVFRVFKNRTSQIKDYIDKQNKVHIGIL